MRSLGWSLKELLVVLAGVVLLSALLIPLAIRIRGEAKRAACQNRITALGTAILEEYARTGMFPEWLYHVSQRTGVPRYCPVDGRQYMYPVGFYSPAVTEAYLRDRFRRDWNRLVVRLLQQNPHYPILYCPRCYDPKLASEIERWEHDGYYWNPIFSSRVGLKSRYLGMNIHGAVDYYNPRVFVALLWRLWDSRFMQHPAEEMGGVPLSPEELKRLVEDDTSGGV